MKRFRSRFFRPLALACLAGAAWCPGEAKAATLPAGFTETKLLGSINPTALEVAPDGRVFLCIKSGAVRIYKNGAWLDTPLLTVDADMSEERGLLGIALDPDWQANPYVYVYYTAKTPAVHNRVSRFKVTGDAAGPENVLLDLNNSIALRAGGWHNGGSIRFGKDGKLLIAAGNNTNNTYSQSLGALLGKILRINPDGSIPSDNPYYATATGANRAIWALGFRNPYTAAVHPVSGRYLINDVGEGTFEEINEGKAGSNYGWPKAEGHAATAPSGLTGAYGDPISYYSHNSGGCAITGGEFYHPAANGFGAEYADLFFFADYCGGWIKTLDLAKGNAVKNFATGIGRPIYLKAGPDGSLYYVARGARAPGVTSGSAADNGSTNDGSLYRIKGPVPTRTFAAPGLEIVPPRLVAGWVDIPAGKTRLELYGASGKRVWSFRRSGAGSSHRLRVRIPRELTHGIHHARLQ